MPSPITTKDIRGAVIFYLKSVSAVTDIVPATRIYPQQVPANPEWPYSHIGALIDQPDQADCLDGMVYRTAIHTYARTVAGQLSGENMADDAKDAIGSALDGYHTSVNGWDMDVVKLPGGTTIRDPSEASSFHSICQIEISVAA